MNHRNRDIEVDAAMLRGGYAAAPAEEEAASLPAMVRNAMAGRWLWASLVAVLLGGSLAVAGYLSTEPQFETDGVIQVIPEVDVVYRAGPESRIANLESFIESEFRALRGARVTNRALGLTPRDVQILLDLADGDVPVRSLADLGFASDPIAFERALRDNLQVRIRPRSTFIEITYASPDVQESYAVVQSILAAYQETRADALTDGVSRIQEALRRESTLIEGRLTEQRQQLARDLGNEILRGDPAGTLRFLVEELNDIEALQREVAQRIEDLDCPPAGQEVAAVADGDGKSGTDEDEGSDVDATQASGREPTAAELESFDPTLGRLRAERDLARSELDRMQQRYQSGHPRIQVAELALNAATAAFDAARADSVVAWRRFQLELEQETGRVGASRVASELSSCSGLRSLERRQQERADTIREEISAITALQASIAARDTGMKTDQERLAGIRERLENLQLQTGQGVGFERVRVYPAQRPRLPSSDKRRKLAAVGLAGGTGFSFALFFVIGTLDRRAYASQQFDRSGSAAQRYAFLGAVPDMDRRPDPDVDPHALAASCVHQVRNRIDALRPNEDTLTIAVGSPQQGDGKTSFAMALGHSYARSGLKTVVVDCDLVGEGLTIAGGLDDRPGFRDVLHHGEINGELVPGGSENLWLLPAGQDMRIGPESIRVRELRGLIARLGAFFDVVIFDGGPMPGSIESIPLVAAVDGVVIVMRRGRQRGALDACVEAIRDAGGHVFGVVLNRARPADCESMVSASAVSLPVADGRRRRMAALADGGMRLSSALRSEGGDDASAPDA